MRIKKFNSNVDNESYHGDPNDLYSYVAYIGKAELNVEPMDSIWWVQDDFVASQRGGVVQSNSLAVIIKGYAKLTPLQSFPISMDVLHQSYYLL